MPNNTPLPSEFYRYRGWFLNLAGLAIVSKQGIVIEVNELFTKLFGYRREEIVGRPISILRSPMTQREVHQSMWESALAGETWSGEIENRAKDNRPVFVRTTIVPAPKDVHASSPTSENFLVIYQDITAETIRRDYERRKAVEAERQSILAGTLHNIGNLQQSITVANNQVQIFSQRLKQAITAYLQNLLLEIPDIGETGVPYTRVHDAMSVILNGLDQIEQHANVAAGAITETVRVLEGFRRQQRNAMKIEQICIDEFIRRVLNIFHMKIITRGISLIVSVSVDPDLVVSWPIERIQQVLCNLLQNAEEAVADAMLAGKISKGEILFGVRISTDLDGHSKIFFTVSDNGGGFDGPVERLFEQGYTTKTYGVGIGLHNSALLAQSIGGRLRATNGCLNGAKGAVFEFSVPLMVAEEHDEQEPAPVYIASEKTELAS